MKTLQVLIVIGGLGVGFAGAAAVIIVAGSHNDDDAGGIAQANAILVETTKADPSVALVAPTRRGEDAALTQSMRTGGDAEQKALEVFLKGAEVSSVNKNVGAGRGAAWHISLHDAAGSRKGLFKYVNIRRPQISPISYKYELAGYALSKLLQIPVVPPVVEREIEGRKGSLQIFLDHCMSETERRKSGLSAGFAPQAIQDALDELAVLEALVSSERDTNDILIHKETGRVCRVDFAEAFDPSPELPASAKVARCSRRLYAGLRDLVPADAETVLKPYLNDTEIKGLLARRVRLFEMLNTRIAAEGEAAVLFDLVLK